MKLLLAPWGKPHNWKEVRYRFEDAECTSKTSLCVLAKKLKPDLVLILVGDSLAESKRLGEDPEYSEVKKAVEEDIWEFLSESGFSGSNPTVEVCVLPGTGYFPNGSFERQILDYYYRLLYELAKVVSESVPSEVHLDLTHGLNFMPVLTYRAVKEVLQVASFFRTVKFTAYNADPFSGQPDEILTLHVVEETEEIPSFPRLAPYEPDESSKFFEKLVLDKNDQGLKTVNKRWLKEVLTFLGGMIYGLPLVLTTFFVPSKEVLEHLKSALKIYEKEVEVFCEDSHLRLTRQARLTPPVQSFNLDLAFVEIF